MPHEPFFPAGHIEVVCGPMFSGKSEELIRRVTRALIAKQRVIVFKPSIDDRYHVSSVASHAGRTAQAHAVKNTLEIREHLGLAPEPALFGLENPGVLEKPLPKVVAFDECQFFDAGLIPLALELAMAGVRVICAGLDTDFRGEPFGLMPELLARAEHVEKLTAICVVCGAPATRTQRLVNDLPARFDDPIIQVGASEAYEPRCRQHHEVPGSSFAVHFGIEEKVLEKQNAV
jgi:thymidine kinase